MWDYFPVTELPVGRAAVIHIQEKGPVFVCKTEQEQEWNGSRQVLGEGGAGAPADVCVRFTPERTSGHRFQSDNNSRCVLGSGGTVWTEPQRTSQRSSPAHLLRVNLGAQVQSLRSTLTEHGPFPVRSVDADTSRMNRNAVGIAR